MSKYTAFDLDILHITVDQQHIPLNVHAMEPINCTGEELTETFHIYEVQHMTFSEMANHLTKQDAHRQAQQQVSHLLQSQQIEQIQENFQDVFHGIGKHKYRQVEVLIDEHVKLIIQPQRNIPFAKWEKFDNVLDQFEDSGVIETVDWPTDWISKDVLTPKADPTQIRMNIDMTTASTFIKRTRHVIPTVEELRYELNGAKHFTKLDMKHGYMQMELNPKSRPITTFYTHRRLRRSRRLMFGINSAAEVFHEEIHQTITGIPGVRNIYDGILVHGKTVEEHNLALIAVLQRLQDCGLTLNINKYIFFQLENWILWCCLLSWRCRTNRGQSSSTPQHTETHNRCRSQIVPRDGKFQFIFHPRLLKQNSTITNNDKKGAKSYWTTECQNAFDDIKQALCQAPVMAYFDPDRKTKLIVDGLATILTQMDPKPNNIKSFDMIVAQQRPKNNDILRLK